MEVSPSQMLIHIWKKEFPCVCNMLPSTWLQVKIDGYLFFCLEKYNLLGKNNGLNLKKTNAWFLPFFLLIIFPPGKSTCQACTKGCKERILILTKKVYFLERVVYCKLSLKLKEKKTTKKRVMNGFRSYFSRVTLIYPWMSKHAK